MRRGPSADFLRSDFIIAGKVDDQLARLHLNSCNVSFDNFAQGEFVMIGVYISGMVVDQHRPASGQTVRAAFKAQW
jgi:hypothetical protein